MSVDRTASWDRQAAIRHALARLERLPAVELWSQDAPAKPDECATFSPADRARCHCLMTA
jgi:hypothetical protein